MDQSTNLSNLIFMIFWLRWICWMCSSVWHGATMMYAKCWHQPFRSIESLINVLSIHICVCISLSKYYCIRFVWIVVSFLSVIMKYSFKCQMLLLLHSSFIRLCSIWFVRFRFISAMVFVNSIYRQCTFWYMSDVRCSISISKKNSIKWIGYCVVNNLI